MTEPHLEGLLVRHVGDIEAALEHLRSAMDPRLWREASRIVGETLPASWRKDLNPDDTDIRFSNSSWGSTEAGAKPQAWFDMDEETPHGEGDELWLTDFLCAGPNGAGVAFFFKQKLLGSSAWKRFMRENPGFLSELQPFGFMYDASDGALYIPIRLDRETLALAFEEDDFAAAFQPLAAVLSALIEASETFDRLVAAARAHAG